MDAAFSLAMFFLDLFAYLYIICLSGPARSMTKECFSAKGLPPLRPVYSGSLDRSARQAV
ncbi:MAG TPA: hypothetical protein DD811_12560 [Syntrophomonas sp.]|jgi:hypothetical protein|nr:hypothetical protein [Syntrophomonas sp.]